MKTYRLTVVRVEDNPDYDEKAAKLAAEASRYPGQWTTNYAVPRQLDTRELEVLLNENEYDAIKHAVMETWK